MNGVNEFDARIIDLNKWKTWTDDLEVDSLFVTVSGSHIYGFPSADSDVDLRGSHNLLLEKVVGLTMPNQTVDYSAVHEGIEVDLVSHDIGKYFNLLIRNNGYILEQVFSPLVVSGQEFLDELRPIAKNCVTKNHFFHYRGFYGTQRKLIEKQNPVTAKAVLYAYRVLCTGIHLMNTGDVTTDLNDLADDMGLTFVSELVDSKIKEKIAFGFDLKEHVARLDDLERSLEIAFENSKLREKPERDPVNDLLVRLRLEQLAR